MKNLQSEIKKSGSENFGWRKKKKELEEQVMENTDNIAK